MKLVAPALLALALALPAAAETRNHSGFDRISVTDRVRVEIAQGDRYSVDITGADAAQVRTRVERGELRISQRDRPWFGNPQVNATVRVTVPELDSVAASRGAEVRARNIRAGDFAVAASMGGEIQISGACRNLSASASMGGVVRADRFECVEADIAASMGGEAVVNASQRYDASASMGGAINVYGGARGDIATSMGGAVTNH